MNEKKKKNHFIMKNKKKKFMVQKLRATAHLSRQVELGAGWAHWARSRARGRGAQGAGRHGRWAARAQARGALERAGSRQGARAAGARTEGRAGRARQQARARAERAGQGRLGGKRAAWALGARPGRLGWPWAVHSVHSAHFRSVLTRFFS